MAIKDLVTQLLYNCVIAGAPAKHIVFNHEGLSQAKSEEILAINLFTGGASNTYMGLPYRVNLDQVELVTASSEPIVNELDVILYDPVDNSVYTLDPGLYWVKWAEGQDWDIGSYDGGGTKYSWYSIGSEEWQDWPDVIGPQPKEPD